MIIKDNVRQSSTNPRVITRLLIRTLVFTQLLTGIGSPALAGEFSIEPLLKAGGRYDSNSRYQPDGSKVKGSTGIIFDVALPMTYRTPRSSVSLTPRAVRSFYFKKENSDLEDRDYYLIGGAGRAFRRSSIGAGFGYTILSLRTSEFANPGEPLPGDPPIGNGDINVINDTQNSWYFQPNWQYQVTPLNVVSLTGGHRDVSYDTGNNPARLFDYKTNNATAAFQHAFTERQGLGLQINLSTFDSKNQDLQLTNESTSNGLSMVYSYSWSERTSISANLGWSRTKSKVTRPNAFFPVLGFFLCNPMFAECTSNFDASNFVGSLTVTRQAETVSYRLLIGQVISPSSNGSQQLRSSINVTASRRFTERFSGQMGILAYTEKNVGDSQFNRDAKYVRSNLGMNYKLSRKYSLYLTYYFTYQKYNTALTGINESRNHFVSAGIQFKGDGWHW